MSCSVSLTLPVLPMNPAETMSPSTSRLVMSVLMLAGVTSSLSGQEGFSLTLGTGGQYLLPAGSLRGEGIWKNANSGIAAMVDLEYQHEYFWAGISVSGVRQRWESGPGSPLWPGRNKPIHHEAGWWSGMTSLTIGQRYSMGFHSQLNLSPYIGVGYDWQQEFQYCGTGATISSEFLAPVSHAKVTSLTSSSVRLGGGVNLDYQILDGPRPVWIRFGVAGWWRQFSMMTGKYYLWHDGGRMAQQPPWGPPTVRPGQKLKMEDCPNIPFTVEPDEIHEIELPGHSLNWSVGIRFDL